MEIPYAVAGALAHPSWSVRHAAAYQAFRNPHASLADPLLKAADDPDLRVRLWAVAALGKTGDPRALAKLLERLDDPELFVRYRAAEGLGFLGHRDAVEPLVRVMQERPWYEGHYALLALRRIEPDRF
jgi:HEAT repeat protein